MKQKLIDLVNRFLAQKARTASHLSKHIGKTVMLSVPPWQWICQVDAQAQLQLQSIRNTSNKNSQPIDLILHARLIDLPLLLANQKQAQRYVRIEGDADLAQSLARLIEQIDFSLSDELSDWVGDMAAHRIEKTFLAIRNNFETTRQKTAHNIAEFLVEERATLVGNYSLDLRREEIIKLRDDVERLLKRVEHLENRLNQ